MGEFSSRLRAGSFWVGAMGSALALTTFQIASCVIGYVLYPLVFKLLNVDLNTIAIRLADSDGDRLQPDLFRSTIMLGPGLRVVLAGLVTAFVLLQGYRWTLRAASEGTVECPYCLSAIPVEATRCAYCGAEQPGRGSQNAETPAP